MKYAIGESDDGLYTGEFDSIEEAIEEIKRGWPDGAWIGVRRAPTQPERLWDADDWLERVGEHDDYHIDASDGWDQSTREQRAELEAIIRPLLGEWLDRHGLRPRFFVVDDATYYTADGVPAK